MDSSIFLHAFCLQTLVFVLSSRGWGPWRMCGFAKRDHRPDCGIGKRDVRVYCLQPFGMHFVLNRPRKWAHSSRVFVWVVLTLLSSDIELVASAEDVGALLGETTDPAMGLATAILEYGVLLSLCKRRSLSAILRMHLSSIFRVGGVRGGCGGVAKRPQTRLWDWRPRYQEYGLFQSFASCVSAATSYVLHRRIKVRGAGAGGP